MTYEVYRYIFYGGAIAAAVMLIISVLLFIFLKIPTVIGDLTGSNARKAIENIRSQNASSGDKTYKTSQVNRERGRLTDKISPSGNLIKNPSDVLGGAMVTEKISTQPLKPEMASNETTILGPESGETTLLDQTGENETAVLAQPTENVFEIEFEITYIHTDEVIV